MTTWLNKAKIWDGTDDLAVNTDGSIDVKQGTVGNLKASCYGSGNLLLNQDIAGKLNVNEASASDIKTAVQVMDDWDNGASDGASVSGDVAHDSPDAGEPVKIGAKANAEEPAAVSENDRANIGTDLKGNQRMVGNVAHDTADTGNPVKIGAKANAEEPAAVSENDRANIGTDLKGNQRMVGNIAHDTADTGNPIKVGSKAIDYQPDTDAEQGASEVAANDRVNITTNLKGELIEGVNSRYHVLENISTTYDADPTTATSSAMECWNYRQATLAFELDKANTPTDIVFNVLVSMDGTNFTKLMNDFLGDLRYDDTAVGSGVDECVTFPICCNTIKIQVVCTGTDGTNTFTVANAQLYLRN